MSATNRLNPPPTPVLYCGDTPISLSELTTDRCPEGFRVEAPSCPGAYFEAPARFARHPLLYFWNDTAEPLIIRRIDALGFPAVTVAPACGADTSNGGPFFGELSRREIAQGQGILVGVFDTAGQRRGAILFMPSYLNGGAFFDVCLSDASEPPLVVNSDRDIRDLCR